MDLAIAWSDERHSNGKPRLHRILSWCTHRMHGFYPCQARTMSLFVHESNETRVVSHFDNPLICAKPVTLEKFWFLITKLTGIKRGETLNPRILVGNLGFEYNSVQESERSTNVHDETTGCARAEIALFRAVVGNLQCVTGSETGSSLRDILSVIQSRIAHTCIYDTCEEDVEIFQGRTRRLNLYLKIPARKPAGRVSS